MAWTSERAFQIEKLDEAGGHCDCCGRESRSVWGLVHGRQGTTAAYWVYWTVSHLTDPGANLDLVLGAWGDGTTTADRYLVSLLHRENADKGTALMVIDAHDRPVARGGLADSALRRDEVVGTPLAAQVFAIVDAIYEQDDRFF